MIRLLSPRVAVVALAVGLLCCGAVLTSKGADEKPQAIATTHYVDRPKHVELDVPLSWERKWPEAEDERVRFMFATSGKSSPNAQPAEFLMVTSPKDQSPKDLSAWTDAVKKQAAEGAQNVKLEKDKDAKVDGEKAVSFGGTRTGKAGPAKFVYIVTLHNGIGYATSFACDPATFDAEYAAAKTVVDSIKWSKGP